MKIEPGDLVEVRTQTGVFRGILVPKGEFTGEDIVVLKLENGYNIGVVAKEIKLIKKGNRKEKRKVKLEEKENRPRISVISTGGTIASYVDYKTGAVHPALTAEDLLFSVPEIEEEANIRASILFNILSEDMHPEYWIQLARKIRDELKESVGVVIPHGTDTMSYTASALAFMFPRLSGPVVLVGSQRSSDRPSSDAYMNLLSAVRVAKTDLGEVAVVMHATTNDDYCHIHRATRVRKMHTSRRDAFKSINSLPMGEVRGREVRFSTPYRRKDNVTELQDKLEKRVALIYYYPGMDASLVERILESTRGAIIMGTGLGHTGTHIIPVLKRYIRDGGIVGMTSQCLYGMVNLNVYSTGRELKKIGVIPLGDMLPEIAYTKLMYLLGNYDTETARDLLPRNLRGEIGGRRMITW